MRPFSLRIRHTLRTGLIGLALFAPFAAFAQTQPQAPIGMTAPASTLLSIRAEGEASASPDIAHLSVGVNTTHADANTAISENASQMQRLLRAVRALGIAERDIQTSHISLHPQYRYLDNQPPQLSGYQASNQLNVRVRDLRKLGATIDTLVANGATQIDGPHFAIDNPQPLYDRARLQALDSAHARAQLYAQHLGLRVVRVVSISEGGGFAPPVAPQHRMLVMTEAKMDSTPIASGESTLQAQLDVVFELAK